MIILSLDTAGLTASVTLMQEYTIMAEYAITIADLRKHAPDRKTHSETLLPMVEHLFKTVGMTIDKVDYIACTCGPGSFTGLRIGAATAKGLAFASGKPLIAVPTLDAMAYTVKDTVARSTCVVPMIDARRGQVYAAIYCDNELKSEYMANQIEDVLDILKEQPLNGCHIIFLGDGAMNNQEIIKQKMGRTVSICKHLRGAGVGLRAIELAKSGQYCNESDFSLLYIRKPQAERELEEKQKCQKYQK